MITAVACTIARDEEIGIYCKSRITSPGDLASPVLGSESPGERNCYMCGSDRCYGHSGHIVLPALVCNPIMVCRVEKALSNMCLFCHEDAGGAKKCPSCGRPIKKIHLGSGISMSDAKMLLKDCGSPLSHCITNTISVVPRMMMPCDIMSVRESYLTQLYTRIMLSSPASVHKHYGELVDAKEEDRGPSSIMSLMKGKEGMFRSLMVGKRVDMCGRAVIVGTDLQDLTIVSLPSKIYKKLTLPVVATEGNMAWLRNMARGGKLYDRMGDEVHTACVTLGREYRRCLTLNDRVLLNRQPSLSRHSMMSFRVTTNPTDCIIINTCITKAYGADFDGDEMGVFLQDNQESMQEMKTKTYIGNNLECVSLVQDVVTIAYMLTRYPRNVSKDTFCDSCMVCKRYDIQYTNMTSSSDIMSLPFDPNFYFYGTVRIVGGKIVSGYLSSSALSQILKEVEDVVKFVRNIQSLVSMLSSREYTMSCGIGSLSIPGLSKQQPYDIDNPTEQELEAMASNFSVASLREMQEIDYDDPLQNMVRSGAKGSLSNIVHMSSSLGYQRLDGKVLDGGLCMSSYLSGMSAKEFFVHQISSREGLVRTNVRTSDVGYSGRRLAKALCMSVVSEGPSVKDCGRDIICSL